ncbi:V-type ATPase subunit [Candidatus Epulonipiscium viviparus]|uniref:V-type ATPase subunit n=1 Tax=Candidatus Epulonipiscium viviparus TaxID=420336 RepID=UPI0027380F44|nr:V-type ATPase subunit [Candidatus Epulopiscium viviparus]
MNEFVSYYAVDAKLKSRKPFLLTREDFSRMIELKDIKQVITYISKKDTYRMFLEEHATEDGIHRNDLEVALWCVNVYEIEKMLHFMSGAYKEFFKLMLQLYELRDIELLIRALMRDELHNGLSKYFIHSKKYATVDFNRLLEARDIVEFTKILNGSIYYSTVRTIDKNELAVSEWHLEMKINAAYYKLLKEKAKSLHEKDRVIATRILGERIDRLNVEWIYRAKRFYELNNEEILLYSLGKGYKISYNRLKNLCYVEDIAKFRVLANKYLGAEIFFESNDLLSKKVDNWLYSKLLEKENISGIGKLMVYIYTLEMDQKDIIAIIEGLRYQLNKDEIKEYLINNIRT